MYTLDTALSTSKFAAAAAGAKQMVNSRNEFYLSEMAIICTHTLRYIGMGMYLFILATYKCMQHFFSLHFFSSLSTHTHIHLDFVHGVVASSLASFCGKFHLCCCTLPCWDFFTSSCCGVLKGGVQRATRTDDMTVSACCTAASCSNRRNVNVSRQTDSAKQAVIGATALIAKKKWRAKKIKEKVQKIENNKYEQQIRE